VGVLACETTIPKNARLENSIGANEEPEKITRYPRALTQGAASERDFLIAKSLKYLARSRVAVEFFLEQLLSADGHPAT
jgi:hypothetical protein